MTLIEQITIAELILGATAISAVIVFLIRLYKIVRKYEKLKEEIEKSRNEIDKMKKENLEQFNKINEELNYRHHIKRTLQAILRDRIIQSYRFFKERESILMIDKDNIANLYQEYKQIGGNGMIEGIYKEIMDIPIELVK